MATVTLDHVTKRYRDVTAVRDLSLDIVDGELMALVGPSGCGKTTVLRLIAGLETPTEGTILIDGRVANDLGPRARNVAMVFENYALYPHLAVRKNLDFALRLRHTPAEEIRRRVSAVAASMELDGLLERKPPGLAAGEAQHVALGRAVVRDAPAVFLFDDALSHLDARQRLEARAELGRLHRDLRATIVMVTHDQAEALAIGSRIAVIDAGVLQQVGPPRTLYEQPANVFVAGFIGSPAMNLLQMRLERVGDTTVLRAGQLALPVPAALAGQGAGVEAGPAAGLAAAATEPMITVGIRPEHIRIGPPSGDDEGEFRGRADIVEFLGHQALVHVRVGDLDLRVFDEPAHRVRAGDIVDCSIALDRVHLFDTRTGRRRGWPATS